MFIFFMIVMLLAVIAILFWQLEKTLDRLVDAEREARFYKERYENFRTDMLYMNHFNPSKEKGD